MSEFLRISVVIPMWNEAACIRAAVDSAAAAGADEILVVDGGSTDGSCQALQGTPCRLLSTLPGRARQQNAGAREATGEVLVFLHADNRLSPGALRQVREAFRDPQVVFAAFRQRIEAPGWKYRLLEWGNAWRVSWRGLPYGDQGICVRRLDPEAAFPEVPFLEDLLLSRRLRRRARPRLLPGPLWVSPRRWERQGVLRQTLRNWTILAAHACGVSPARLAQFYRPAQQRPPAAGAREFNRDGAAESG